MTMHNTHGFFPCSRTSLLMAACVVGGLSSAASARGGEHTDFPDLSIKLPPNKGPSQSTKKIFDLMIGKFVDGEGNMVLNDSLVAPTFPPKPTLPEHGYTLEPAASVTNSGGSGSNVSAIPTPGVGTMLVVGAAAAGLRRRRR